MTWRQWHAARQHLAEERVGAASRLEGSREDAEFNQTVEALRRVK